jgi:signal transduction histidine kinase/HAMP domain-containing protein
MKLIPGWLIQALNIAYPRVRARVITPFLVIVIVMAGLGVFTVTRLVAGSLQERFSNQLAASSDAAKNTAVAVEEGLLEQLRLLVYVQGVPSLIQAGDAVGLDAMLRPIIANAALDDVNIADEAGAGILRLRRMLGVPGIEYEVMEPFAVRAWEGAARVLAGQVDALGDKYADVVDTSTGLVLFITAPVTTADGAFVGTISVGIRMDRFAVQMREQSLSAVAFYDLRGELLASTFQGLSETDLALDTPTLESLMDGVTAQSPLIERQVGGEVYQLLFSTFDIRSRPVGLLAVGLQTNFIVDSVGTSRDLLAALFGALTMTILVFGLIISRSITQPINRLVQTTRAITQGDLTRRVELKTPDELGELGVSFDHMTDELVQQKLEIAALYQGQLQETARREAMLNNINDAVIVQDAWGNVLLENPTAKALNESLRKQPKDMMRLTTLLSDPALLEVEHRLELAGRNLSATSASLRMPSGESFGRVTVLRDFTAIAQAEKLKDDLIMQMSHELRTPLSVVRGNADLLRLMEKKRLSEKGDQYLSRLIENVRTLERLVNQVVDVSTITAGRFSIDRQPIDIKEILHETTAHWQPIMEARELIFENSIPDIPLIIEGDRNRLIELMDHVLRNSYDYTLPGGRVAVRVDCRERWVVIDVLDTGVGIQPDEIDRVFDSMYRGTASAAGPTDSRGMGVGLFISKCIVELHQGRIRLGSVQGQGTHLRVELPISSRMTT